MTTPLYAEAAAAWPDVTVDERAFAEAIAARTDVSPAGAAELYLAIACARGDAAGLAAFERAVLDVVPQALAAMKLPAATVDDVRAAVREKLLVGEPSRILAYAGRGQLRGLVHVTATRTALDRIRAERRETGLPARELAAPADVELSLIKAQYRGAFAEGFARAVADAPRRDRNLLRLHFLGGVTLDALAQMYGVHRATVVRWLAAAREAVLGATRAHMKDALGASAEELDEMFALVESRVELSLERMLATVG